MKKIYAAAVFIAAVTVLFCSCSKSSPGNNITETEGNSTAFTAVIKKADATGLLVEVPDDVTNGDALLFAKGTAVSVAYENAGELSAGDTVSIVFDGEIRETYPPQIRASLVVAAVHGAGGEKASESVTRKFIQTDPVLDGNLPVLTVTVNGEKYTACQNHAEWNGVTYQGESPLRTTGYCCIMYSKSIENIELEFSSQPDSFAVCAWGEENIGNENDESKAVFVTPVGNTVPYKSENAVYRVTAEWENGTVQYSFYIG